jgi:hypothetical protein
MVERRAADVGLASSEAAVEQRFAALSRPVGSQDLETHGSVNDERCRRREERLSRVPNHLTGA